MMDSTTRSRLSVEAVYLRLKAEWRRLVTTAGGYEHAAQLTRGGAATLHRHGDPLRPDLYPAVDTVVDLEMATGAPHVTAMMAGVQGYRLERLDPRPPANETPGEQALLVVKEVGDFAAAVRRLGHDGPATATDYKLAISEGERLREAVEAALDDLYRRMTEAGGATPPPES